MHTIESAYQELRERLAMVYDKGETAAIAHGVLEHLTGLNRLQRLSAKNQLLTEAQAGTLSEMTVQLLAGTPLQYVTGEAYFMGRTFAVSPAVLIPRPETEELVQWIVSEQQAKTLLDVGTGSGCIAISLRLSLSNCDVVALDVSDAALAVAALNADKLNAVIKLLKLDFLDAAGRDGLAAFDVIVSNPPYIPISEKESLEANVREHEPATALFVPDADALLFYRAIAEFGLTHLNAGGAIYCELHQNYANEAAMMFAEKGYSSVTLRKDINGNPRMIRVKF